MSAMVSPWPSCISLPDSTIVSPPIWRTPTSKRDAGAGRGLFEDQRDHAALQRLVVIRRALGAAVAGRLHRMGGVDHRPQVRPESVLWMSRKWFMSVFFLAGGRGFSPRTPGIFGNRRSQAAAWFLKPAPRGQGG